MNVNVMVNEAVLAVCAVSFGFWAYFTIYYIHVLRKHTLRPTRRMSIKAIAWVSVNVALTSLITGLYRVTKIDLQQAVVPLDGIRMLVMVSFLLSGIYIYKVDKKLAKSFQERGVNNDQ